jgi:hypothetical protein
VSLTAGSGGTAVSSDLNGNITLVAGAGISLSGNNTAKTVTIAASSAGTVNSGAANAIAYYPSAGTTVDDSSFTQVASGHLSTGSATDLILSTNNNTSSGSITIADGASGNITIATNGTGLFKVNADLDLQTGIIGTSTTNASIEIEANGTGVVNITGSSILNVATITNGGSGVVIDPGTVGLTSTTDADLYITPNGTGKLIVVGDMAVGDAAAGAIIHSNWNNTSSFLTLRARNSTTVGELSLENANSYLKAGGAATAGRVYIQAVDGDVHLQPKTSTGRVVVGAASGTGGSTITSFTTNDLVLNTNSGTNSGSITITQGSNANIVITPNGTGETIINNLVATETIVANGNTGAATLTPNAALGAVQSYTVTGNITLNAFGTPLAGQSITLILTQGGSGSYVLTSTMKWAGASKTLSTAVGAVDIVSVYYDGTNYWASLSKGFA